MFINHVKIIFIYKENLNKMIELNRRDYTFMFANENEIGKPIFDITRHL